VLVILTSSAAADVAAVPTPVASATPSSGASEPDPAVSVVASATPSSDSNDSGASAGVSRGRGLGCGDSPGLRNPATLRRLPGGRFELGLLREDDNTRSVSASASLVIGVRVPLGVPLALAVSLFTVLVGLLARAGTDHRDLSHPCQFPFLVVGVPLHLSLQPQDLGRIVLLLADVRAHHSQELGSTLVIVDLLDRDVVDIGFHSSLHLRKDL